MKKAPDSRRHSVRPDGGAERRSVPRIPIEVEVSVHSESQFYVGLTGDLSAGGLFVATWRRLPVGAEIELVLSLPDGPVNARGRVRWVRDLGEGVAPGLGVEFDELSAADRQRVETFCTQRAPLYVDVD